VFVFNFYLPSKKRIKIDYKTHFERVDLFILIKQISNPSSKMSPRLSIHSIIYFLAILLSLFPTIIYANHNKGQLQIRFSPTDKYHPYVVIGDHNGLKNSLFITFLFLISDKWLFISFILL